MFLKKEIETVYFADTFAADFPELFGELKTILEQNGDQVRVLKGTYDYWCRDYMPIPVNDKDLFVQFKYHPDYLEEKREFETPAKISTKITETETHGIVIQSPIIADGGNFTFCSIKRGRGLRPVIILTEKIFAENPNIEKNALIEQLTSIFKHDLLFLDWDKEDICGHTDGIVHPVGHNKVLVNLEVYSKDIANRMREWLEKYFKVIDLKLSDYHELSWAYINMLQTKNIIIVPGLGLPTDSEALEHIKKLYPDYKDRIYQVQMREIVEQGGALNCITWMKETGPFFANHHCGSEEDIKNKERFYELMNKFEKEDRDNPLFTNEELMFMGEYDLSSFSKKFPYHANWFCELDRN